MESSIAEIKEIKKKGVPSEIDEHVGKRLRQLRSSLGWSQEKLADAIQITFQQVQKYERGVNRISAGRLFSISKVFEVPVSYFFENMISSDNSYSYGMSDNDQKEFESTPSIQLSSNIATKAETEELLRSFYSINDASTRKEILKLIKEKASIVT